MKKNCENIKKRRMNIFRYRTLFCLQNHDSTSYNSGVNYIYEWITNFNIAIGMGQTNGSNDLFWMRILATKIEQLIFTSRLLYHIFYNVI